MFSIMVEYTKSLTSVLNGYAISKEAVLIKEIIERFVMDGIGSSVFGIELDTLHNKNEDFKKTVKKVSFFDWRRRVAMFCNREFLRILRFKTIRYTAWHYFKDIVKSVIEYRETNNVYRRDIFQYLLQLKDSGSNKHDEVVVKNHKMTLNQITTQCFTLLSGGYDTSSVLINFVLLELAMNLDIQQRLRDNIQEILKKYEEFTYEAVNEMYYLDWIINGNSN